MSEYFTGGHGYPTDWPEWMERPEIPEGWEFIRVGFPIVDEFFLTATEVRKCTESTFLSSALRIIVKKQDGREA